MYTCILWDVDGTLADATAGIMPRLVAVLDSFGLPEPSHEELVHWIGPPMVESFQARAGLSATDAAEAVSRYRTMAAAEGYASSVSLYPGVPETLRTLWDLGIPQATASTKPENQVRAILDHYDLTKYFTAISGARSGEEGLTDGKSIVLGWALERLAGAGADVSRPVLIGDRHHDIDGAADYGIPVIWSSWGFGSPQEAAGSIATADSLADVLKLVL